MDDDDRAKKPAPHVVGMSIETISVDELKVRIDLLEAEIERLKAAIAAREKSRSAAESVFKL